MDYFNFAELFSFLQTVLGMILAYMGGRRSMKRNAKSRPNHGRKSGSTRNKK